MKKMKTKNRAIPNPTAYANPLSRYDLRSQIGAAAVRTHSREIHALFHPSAAAAAGAGDGFAVKLDDFGIPIVYGFDDSEIFHI